jgi:hypothetical protein
VAGWRSPSRGRRVVRPLRIKDWHVVCFTASRQGRGPSCLAPPTRDPGRTVCSTEGTRVGRRAPTCLDWPERRGRRFPDYRGARPRANGRRTPLAGSGRRRSADPPRRMSGLGGEYDDPDGGRVETYPAAKPPGSTSITGDATGPASEPATGQESSRSADRAQRSEGPGGTQQSPSKSWEKVVYPEYPAVSRRPLINSSITA